MPTFLQKVGFYILLFNIKKLVMKFPLSIKYRPLYSSETTHLFYKNEKDFLKDFAKVKQDLLFLKSKIELLTQSNTKIKEEIITALEELFNAANVEKITMPLDAITKDLLCNKYERNYIKKTLDEMGISIEKIRRLSYPRFVEKIQSNKISMQIEYVHFFNHYYEFNRLQN